MIADLLAGEVIDRQPDDVRELMLCSSIVDDFDADLCELLTGRNDSRSRLEALERETHFRRDGRREAADVSLPPSPSRPVARRTRPALSRAVPRICTGSPLEHWRSAARSCAAVGHYLACGDRDQAFELVFDRAFDGYSHVALSEVTGVGAWLGVFPVDYLAESISRMLRCAFALSLCSRWDEAHAWLNRAARALDADPLPRDEDATLLDVLRLHEFIAEGGGRGRPRMRATSRRPHRPRHRARCSRRTSPRESGECVPVGRRS